MDILLQDTTKEPSDLSVNPRRKLYTNIVPNPRISDAELEAELEKLSLSEGGMALCSQGRWWACGPLGDNSLVMQPARAPKPGKDVVCYLD